MRNIILSFLLLLPLLGLGQNMYHDVLYLKNGSIIKGTIIDQGDDGSVTLLIGGRQSVSFYREEIDRMEKEARLNFQERQKKRGYFTRTQMGTSIKKERNWQGPYTTLYPSFQTVHGYQWSRFLQTGLGLGTDFYPDVVTIPFFFHLSGELSATKITPIYEIQIGDSFVLSDKISGNNFYDKTTARGFFRIAGGIQINNPANSFYISVGFKKNKVEYSSGDMYYSTKVTQLYRSFSIGFGMKF